MSKNKPEKKDKPIKILHVGNTGGVASVLTKIQNEEMNGYKAKFIARSNQDYYKMNDAYKKHGIIVPFSRAIPFYFVISLYILFKRPRVIQIHGWPKGFRILNVLLKFFWRKPFIIYHGHGSEMRGKDLPYYVLKTTNQILVSTRDLLFDFKSILHLSNPVDKDIFYESNGTRQKNTVLYIRNYLPVVFPYDFMDVVKDFAKRHELKLTVLDRLSALTKEERMNGDIINMNKHRGDFIPYAEMGDYLRQFEYFLDFKGVAPILSKAGLEAVSTGCIVVQEDMTKYTKANLDPNQNTINFIDYYNKLAIAIKEWDN